VHGEQLIAQLFRSIPEKTWLFKYGRIPLNFVLNEKVLERLIASPLDTARCKVSVIAEATANVQVLQPGSNFLPFDSHFYPSHQRSADIPLSAIRIIPHEEQLIAKDMLDKWDYCLRRLFVLKSTPLKSAIVHLGAGAQSLLKEISDPSFPPSERVDANRSIRRLEVGEWAKLVKAFDEWPFAPDNLFIGDVLGNDRRH